MKPGTMKLEEIKEIIKKYYRKNEKARRILVEHSEKVKEKAIEIAEKNRELEPDFKFIEEASMLHDIGIFLTYAPSLHCHGKFPYIVHGYLGREILEKEGLKKHALVCERHVGTGISKEEIEKKNLPLPKRDMLPISVEEKIICLADKFYSKMQSKEKSIGEIRKGLLKFGKDKVKRFDELLNFFNYPQPR